MIDKAGILSRLDQLGPVYLELGCGTTKRCADAIGIDRLDATGVDLVGDVFEVLEAFPAGSVQEVASYHFFEHIEDTAALLSAIARVLRSGGRLRVVVPHFSNPFFYSDPTHKAFFGLYSFSYFAQESLFRRKVGTYGRKLEFTLERVQLVFKSYRPNFVRHALKKALQGLVNSSAYSKEFYEENLSGVLPCYEVEFELSRL